MRYENCTEFRALIPIVFPVLHVKNPLFESDTHDSDGVIKQRLSKHNNVEDFIDVDFLKNGEYSDRIDGRDERRKKERIQQRQIESVQSSQTTAP